MLDRRNTNVHFQYNGAERMAHSIATYLEDQREARALYTP